ncbi:MAG: dicarboxylate/amino acid:cation symporter [Oscillibacter sp.]
MTKKKPALALWILIALILGILAGLAFMGNSAFAVSYIKPFGTIFLNLIKFIVVPIVFFSIMSGILSMSDMRKVGSIGVKTVVYYFLTTAGAIVLGLFVANLFKGAFPVLNTAEAAYEAKEATGLMDTFVNIFPSNVVAPFANASMLQVIVASLLFGFGILAAGEKAKPFADFIDSATEVSMRVMSFIIQLSPIGVFCMIVPVVAENGPAILGSLGMVLLCAYICYIIHAAVVYSSTVKILGGLSPLAFFKGMIPAMAMAFSSASSVGTLPLNMECVEHLGARRDVSSFVLPLGATINMDGTAIYQGVCTVFIACCYGVDLTLGQMATIVLTATLASIGTAGVPGAGMVMLAMVLESVGLPVAGIGLVLGVDRIFDMGRTTVNITGDAACAIVVSTLENKKEARLAAKAKQ